MGGWVAGIRRGDGDVEWVLLSTASSRVRRNGMRDKAFVFGSRADAEASVRFRPTGTDPVVEPDQRPAGRHWYRADPANRNPEKD